MRWRDRLARSICLGIMAGCLWSGVLRVDHQCIPSLDQKHRRLTLSACPKTLKAIINKVVLVARAIPVVTARPFVVQRNVEGQDRGMIDKHPLVNAICYGEQHMPYFTWKDRRWASTDTPLKDYSRRGISINKYYPMKYRVPSRNGTKVLHASIDFRGVATLTTHRRSVTCHNSSSP